MLTRRHFAKLSSLALAAPQLALPQPPDYRLDIAPFTLEASPRHHLRTIAYNGQVPGPLLRLQQGHPVTIEITNRTSDPELVHWHGLFLPPEIDGAMEEATPMLAPGATTRVTFTPDPAGLRWYHTHTFAGSNLSKAQYSGQHGFLLIDPPDNPGRYDREVFLALHDWAGRETSSDDGFMNPTYEFSTVNGRMLGFGDPIQVRQGERVLLHILNSSPTEVHWVALAGHRFHVLALDGNPVPQPRTLDMLRLAPAERISALVEMNSPGLWVFGEVRKHIQAAGLGIVFAYANATGKPQWNQPASLVWDYRPFAVPTEATTEATRIPLVIESRFHGHGAEETWTINGRSYPNTEEPILKPGQRYRLLLDNRSADDHPIHLHRHVFEVRRLPGSAELSGLRKDVILAPAQSITEIEFTATHPGRTLLHCHQQNHMDRGFMMVFRYA